MTVIRPIDIMTEEIEEAYDYSRMYDTSRFFMPAECFISEEDYYAEKEIYYEKTIQKEKFAKITSKEQYIAKLDEVNYDFSYASIIDLSDISPAEIEIEDEIKMGYLWSKYQK